MYNYSNYNFKQKAGIFTCLFCLVLIPKIFSQDIDTRHKEAFSALLDLDYTSAAETIHRQKNKSAFDYYYLSLISAIELMIEQDRSKVEEFFTQSTAYLKELKTLKEENALVVKAEIEFHQAMVYALNEQEFYAAYSFRQSFLSAKQVLNKFPDNKYILKTAGIHQLLLGSSPEKYDWILNILGMNGDVKTGLDLLSRASKLPAPYSDEVAIWNGLLSTYVLQKSKHAAETMVKLNSELNGAKLISFLAGVLSIKNSDSEKAIALLSNKKLPVIVSYHLAEALLHKGEFMEAEQHYIRYIDQTKSPNLIKDSYFKSGMCMLFIQDSTKAKSYFDLAKSNGSISVEADKYASKTLENINSINIQLQKARYFTDGGYYKLAEQTLDKLNDKDLPTRQEQVEYYYRKGRISHKSQRLNEAIIFYKQVIDQAGQEPWYFAPNSALNLGYIFEEKGDAESAIKYFKLSLSYKKHEYKSSIDSKARSGLAQLNADK